jgi:two-component system nitrogen regulation response regulator GlnG
MRRLAALTPQEVITGDIVKADLASPEPSAPAAAFGGGGGAPETLAAAVERHLRALLVGSRDGVPTRDIYDQVLAEVERPLIRMTLAATRGNQIKAAAMLGLNRNTLRKKIRDLEIPVMRGVG